MRCVFLEFWGLYLFRCARFWFEFLGRCLFHFGRFGLWFGSCAFSAARVRLRGARQGAFDCERPLQPPHAF